MRERPQAAARRRWSARHGRAPRPGPTRPASRRVDAAAASLHLGDRLRELRQNPYYNALQVKFAYALTCHKTQGGQWRTVIIDQGFLPPDQPLGRDYLRWLYTAFTRATGRVYLLGFGQEFFV